MGSYEGGYDDHGLGSGAALGLVSLPEWDEMAALIS